MSHFTERQHASAATLRKHQKLGLETLCSRAFLHVFKSGVSKPGPDSGPCNPATPRNFPCPPPFIGVRPSPRAGNLRPRALPQIPSKIFVQCSIQVWHPCFRQMLPGGSAEHTQILRHCARLAKLRAKQPAKVSGRHLSFAEMLLKARLGNASGARGHWTRHKVTAHHASHSANLEEAERSRYEAQARTHNKLVENYHFLLKSVHGTVMIHRSQGTVERPHMTLYGQVRSIRIGLAHHLGIHSDQVDGLLFPRIAQHASRQISRYLIRSDGRTSYERVFNKPQRSPIVDFGERVVAHVQSQPQLKSCRFELHFKVTCFVARQGCHHRHAHCQPQ